MQCHTRAREANARRIVSNTERTEPVALYKKLEFIQESDLKKTDTTICPARIKAFEVRCVLTR